MIEFNEDIKGIWCAAFEGGDYLLALYPSKIVFRFRYHKDDKIFDSKDKKSWYTAKSPGLPLEKQIIHLRDMMKEVKLYDIEEVLRGDMNLEEFTAEFVKMDSAHISFEKCNDD